MNIPVKVVKTGIHMSRIEALDAFHLERSRCIDSFAAVEEAVIALSHLLGIRLGAESFGNKIEALKKATAGPKFSKARLQKLLDLLPICAELNQLRNDIIHSRLQIAEIAGEHRACFTNTRECLAGSQTARLFTVDGMKTLNSSYAKLATDLRQVLINPASSPPPPSRDAAGGP